MKAVVFRGAGATEVIELEDRPPPEAGPGEVVVEVAAAGLNRADLLQRRGLYPAPPGAPADVPGLELSGTVVACGAGVVERKVGDRVMTIVGGGAMAERVAVHERTLVPVPGGIDLVTAGGVPEVFATAHDALFTQAGLAMGETVLIHAVGSGVGTAAMQLARAAGATAIGTSRTADKLARAAALGLDHGVVVSDGTFADRVKAATGGRGADVILDLVGAAYLEENLKAVARTGRIVVIGLMGGAKGTLSLGALLERRVSITGSVLRSRPLEEKAAVAQALARHVVPLLADGRVRPVIDAVLPMAEVRAAHQRLEQNDSFGKLVLRW